MGKDKEQLRRDVIDFAVAKKRIAVHLIFLFLILIGFCFSAFFTVSNYNGKTKLLSILSDMRILRTEATTDKVRYLYTIDESLEEKIIDSYRIMYEGYANAISFDGAYSPDITRLRVLTTEERRIFSSLVALLHYRGFTSEYGEYLNFTSKDDSLRELLLSVGRANEKERPGQPQSFFDFSAAIAYVVRDFALYSHFILENADADFVNEKAAAVTDRLQAIIDHLPADTARPGDRESAERLIRNKMQVFTRITGYDRTIMKTLTILHETEQGILELLENLYGSLQENLQRVRRVSIALTILFFIFMMGVVSTFIIMINKSEQYSLRKDVRVAELANKAKSNFLSNISHEIRSPLNAVLGLDELIIRESNEKNIVSYALSIQRSGKTLLSLINDVLDFSKIEAGKIEIIPAEYDITSMVGDLYNMIAPRAQEKKLAFNIHINENIPHLLIGDEMRIKQCVLNILTNGVKYTNEGSVTLDIDWHRPEPSPEKQAEKGDSILLTVCVSDTGIGIREADMPKLFKAFERIEERRNRTIEGSGLGMAIVNNLLSLMGTELSVQSEYGKGSAFSFEVEQQVADWTPVGTDAADAYKKVLSRNVAPAESFTAPEARVLVVDDTAINLTVVKGLLKPTLMQVDTALSGHEALKLVAQNRYDLIFLDHRMPVMDGIETLRFMQTLDTNLNKDVPVIALTANAVSGAREMYLKEGFADYMSKPIDIARLEKMLKEYLPQNALLVAEGGERLDPQQDARYKAALERLGMAEGIDLEAGLANCGGADMLEKVLFEYFDAIDERSTVLESYLASEDWENYTVAVHALKSTSRLIGALPLSKEAAHLEHCGDILRGRVPGAGEGTVNAALGEIRDGTAALLEHYRSYLLKLSAFATAKEAADESAGGAGEKPHIDVQTFISALTSLRECMQISDFTLADQIITMIDGYRIEEPFRSFYKRVKAAVTAVDPARVIAAIDAALS